MASFPSHRAARIILAGRGNEMFLLFHVILRATIIDHHGARLFLFYRRDGDTGLLYRRRELPILYDDGAI